jgi:hypothetical protein
MNDKDNFQVAQDISMNFSDSRVTQFYDSSQISGKIFAENLPINATVAWDIYLFYGKNRVWDDHLPKPIYWMHQMSDTDAGSENLRCGEDLVDGLHDSMKSLFG